MARKHWIFNLNIIISGLLALFVASNLGSFFDSLYGQNELTSLVSTITHFSVYIVLNSLFHYITNKRKYTLFGKKLFVDLGKIYGTQVPTFVLYYGVFFLLIDILLHQGINPIYANIIAWMVGTLLSRIVHTYLADKAGVFAE